MLGTDNALATEFPGQYRNVYVARNAREREKYLFDRPLMQTARLLKAAMDDVEDEGEIKSKRVGEYDDNGEFEDTQCDVLDLIVVAAHFLTKECGKLK